VIGERVVECFAEIHVRAALKFATHDDSGYGVRSHTAQQPG
jgi:hypothetical protein